MKVNSPHDRTYNIFRILVVDAKQPSFAFDSRPKEELLYEQFVMLSKKSPVQIHPNYKVYGINPNEHFVNIFKFQIGKNSRRTLHKEEQGKPVSYKAPDLKLVDVVYSWQRQLLFVNKNSLFDDHEIAKVIQSYLFSKLKSYGFVVHIEPLPSVIDFWRTMRYTRNVYELDLEISQLNINEGDEKFREVLRIIKNASNDESFILQLKNKLGQLSINNPTIKGIINYIADVGGKFKVKYKQLESKRKVTYYSDNHIKTTILPPFESISDADMQGRLNALDEEDNEPA